MKDWNKLQADEVRLVQKHFTKGRAGNKVNKVIIHYNYGDLSISGIWSVWQTRPASAHYQVDRNGRIGQLVWDSNTAWHSGNSAANRTSIGVEHANGSRGNPTGPLTEACIDNGAHLVAALCKYYGLGRPAWKVNVFPHQSFSRTACPGPLVGSQHATYMARAKYWYDQMTGAQPAPQAPTSKPAPPSGYTVTVTANVLNVRKGPGTKHGIATSVRKGQVYTIVETQGQWGKLKSGAGWIHLGYTKR